LQQEGLGQSPRQCLRRSTFGDNLDQRQGQEDGHRVVAARLDLQGRADPVTQGDAPDPEQEEDGGGVGRTDDGPHQHALEPGEREKVVRGDADQGCCQQHPDRGERERRPGNGADRAEPRLEATVEQNDCKRDGAQKVGASRVIEGETADPILASQQPDRQEDEQQRCADPESNETGEHTDGDETGADEDGEVHRIDHASGSFKAGAAVLRISG
jgi:hypothetical protein